ncbi:DegT/DnrJ/EryC1/StrS family aminotransferase [Paenibacillus naphthalenovorans]|uniref:DegT/DnrJ/EryC1/StrS family aminotransferase n=1 Tax=Paenibacillus naphthalenovorans TaxID=162209 RepID=UPI0010AF36BD|nr:DegT/DnrJ/EryC1/StrS family aminotransferase [Paenibacillus naphthalenovorans]GCL72383.1 DegT/DnrJ/EryC1/StrS family aminotransferase [Paenibacillus naphthalenovorans]
MISIAKPIIDENEKRLVLEVLESGELASGRYVKQFEEMFAAYTGVSYGVAASSGTTALHAALIAMGIGPGDKVVTTPFSFIASANAILYCGAVPVFCDVKSDTFHIDPIKLEEVLQKEKDVKAVIVVHLYGLPADMKEICEIADRYQVLVLEDCAQSHGASYQGKTVGSLGSAGAFSFYPTKNMTTGEGGLITTNLQSIAEKARCFINHGQMERYNHVMLGHNFRLTNIQAAIGIAQLGKINDFNQRRLHNANYLNQNIHVDWAQKPFVPEDRTHVYHQYTLKLSVDRERFIAHLQENQIGYGLHYQTTIPNQPVYRELGYRAEEFPVSLSLAQSVISLPVHPSLTNEELEKVCDAVNSFKG